MISCTAENRKRPYGLFLLLSFHDQIVYAAKTAMISINYLNNNHQSNIHELWIPVQDPMWVMQLA